MNELLPVLTIPDAQEMIRWIVIKHRMPVMLWGQPGVGKTALVRDITDQYDGYLCDIRLGQYDSVDMRGFPGVSEDNRTVWYAPATLPFVGNEDLFPGDALIILFLDEVNSATQAVFAVAMQLIHERRIGEHILMDRVRIVAAGNREGDRGVANKMPTTVANRLKHYEIVVDVDAYCYYRQAKGALPEEIAFYQFRKPLLNTFDPASPAKAFATPRSSEDAWIVYQDDEVPEKIRFDAMQAAIGAGPMAEIRGFLRVWQNIIPIEDILDDPEGVKLPREASMQYAVTVNVSGHMNPQNVEKLYTFLKRMPPEFVVLAWNLAAKRNAKILSTRSFLSFSREYKAVYGDA